MANEIRVWLLAFGVWETFPKSQTPDAKPYFSHCAASAAA